MSSEFLVDVFELARRAAAVEGTLALAAAARLRNGLRHAEGALTFRLQGLHDARGRPAAVLTLRGTLPLVCDRCLQPLDMALDHEATFFFVRSETELAELPVGDEPEEPLVGSRHFDVLALVEDEAILCQPISPRHAQCSPVSSQQQRVERSDSPFAVLTRLRHAR
ncbi:MAG: DUF177 domain-containing protein [Sutterellaceae bacterium]|nr:DUF177 domain-containing protein [Burkholderiaceae bacterium]MCX7900949.1 DUF177 domain-containing protein [Burkholderiaceae bacterium]MDW8429826.1 DUF177 domain-containing protein [Sutterellaceae bacterium]